LAALVIHFVLYRVIRRRSSPLFEASFDVPNRKDIDARLVGGAALFGVGWGLGGLCPGPGLVAAASGSLGALVFVAGMSIGMLVENRLATRSARPRAPVRRDTSREAASAAKG
jgi:uncharacterized membrane protein YedE/YeeE